MPDNLKQNWEGTGVKHEVALIYESTSALNGMLHKMIAQNYNHDDNVVQWMNTIICIIRRLNELEDFVKEKCE